jgi:peptide deformylase|tara:strand:- start:1529 stop:1969 length:441 start_codon:yes stop_codon:yes gene_type:complete
MIKDLINNTDTLLSRRVNNCSYNLDRSELAQTLVESMLHHRGVGLSANQIGINERAFAMVSDIETMQVIVVFNPKIIKEYNKKETMEEGCLSYPETFLQIERPYSIVVKFEDEDKKVHKIKMEGLMARIFQHEYDHMEGINFTQRV